ncbi:hypothetical protein J4437_04320 [Candidatus Woesearchaeota archaeon]|nr:hypothetical protein [Candidatus Woesearchaeota archaeon]
MDAVTVKFEDTFLHVVEKAMKEHNYTTKAEFIREAIRDKLKELEKEKYLMRAIKLHGAGKDKHNITDEDLHQARERAVNDLAEELGVKLN